MSHIDIQISDIMHNNFKDLTVKGILNLDPLMALVDRLMKRTGGDFRVHKNAKGYKTFIWATDIEDYKLDGSNPKYTYKNSITRESLYESLYANLELCLQTLKGDFGKGTYFNGKFYDNQ